MEKIIYKNEKYYQIRIGDLNYGNHLGHDKLITIIHDARCSFFENYGFKELSIGEDNVGLIVNEINFKYKSQLYYSDNIKITSKFYELSPVSVKMESIVKNIDNGELSASGFIKLVSFNFKTNKMVKFPEKFIALIKEHLIVENF
jgi:YbgC/YbaW family acyl-CoA thioester hydrolase